MNVVLGIDPGKGGAIAAMYDGVIHLQKLDATEADILEFLSGWCVSHAFIERVSSSPQMGVVSAFTFGRGYGFLRGCLVAIGIPFEEITPQKWQKEMGCLSKGQKNVTRSRAQQLFPREKVFHWNADAILLAEYGRRQLALRSHAEPT